MILQKSHSWECNKKMLFFILLIFFTFSFLATGCEGAEAYVGGELGPVEVILSVDENGKVSVTGGFSPEASFGLGPVDLKIGVQKTLELTKSSPFTLFIVYQYEDGDIYIESYDIGEEFVVKFSGNEKIAEIQGDSDSIIVVVTGAHSINSQDKLNESSMNQESVFSDNLSITKNSNISAEQFIIQYYNEISNENYQTSWAMLSEHFKKNYNSSGFQPYVDWWNTVETAEVLSVNTKSQNTDAVTLFVEMKYYYKNGQIDTYDLMEFVIVPFSDTWQIDDASLISGNP